MKGRLIKEVLVKTGNASLISSLGGVRANWTNHYIHIISLHTSVLYCHWGFLWNNTKTAFKSLKLFILVLKLHLPICRFSI